MKRMAVCWMCITTMLLLCTSLAFGAPSLTDVTDLSGASDRGKGKGVALADIDGDGDWDMFVSNKGGADVLYRNDSTPGKIRFTDITAAAGDNLGDMGYSMGSSFADVDNDGRPDLFMAKGGVYEIEANRLLRNESANGRIHFRDVTREAGLDTKDFTYGAAWADIDNDGDLDLFCANYGVGVKNRLFRNDSKDGKIRFTEITDAAGVGDRAWSWSASFADINNDGWQDLYVVNGRYPAGEPNRMYLNQGNGTFRDVSRESGLDDANWGLGATFADVDGDGDMDVFLSNYVGPNRMFLNDGTGRFAEVSKKLGLDHVGWGKGPSWGDVDHDGRLELYEGDCKLANQFYDWDEAQGKYLDIAGRLPVIQNEGVRTKATQFADLDGDGDLDLYVVNWNVANRVYLNNQNDAGWLKIRAQGTVSNRAGIGSKVDVYPAGRAESPSDLVAHAEMTSFTGFCSAPPPEVHVGLRKPGKYDVVVTFPSGRKEILRGVATGQLLRVTESDPGKVAQK
jgi:hypothetical protein